MNAPFTATVILKKSFSNKNTAFEDCGCFLTLKTSIKVVLMSGNYLDICGFLRRKRIF